jgi:hypothetical protein
MSRLTGADAYGLMEAYQAVYAPQELTEEQVWEEVETWVNSLLEEGYDLSDYTWEEMYEAYIEELTNPINDLWNNRGRIAGAANRAYSGTMRGADAAVNQLGTSATNTAKAVKGAVTSPRVAAAVSGFNAGGLVPAISGALSVKGSPADKDKPVPPADKDKPVPPADKDKPVPPADKDKPVPPADKDKPVPPTRTPAAPTGGKGKVAPTKPSGPAMGKLGGTTFERRTPTSAELKAAQAARASGASPEKALQAAKSASAPKVAPSNTLSNTVAAASKPAAFSPAPEVAKTAPTPAAKPTPRQQRLNMEMEYDTFDAILEHLVAEGYADTEESALAIMANMSEEWRESIIVEAIDIQEKLKPGTKGQISFSTGKQNFDQKMTEKNPKTGRQRGTSPELKAMGAHGRARSKQAAAERSGDTEAARRNEKRRGKLAHIVYNKTGRIIDRADND